MTIAQDRRRRRKLDDALARAFTPPILRVMRREEKRVLAASSPASAIAAVKVTDWIVVLSTLWRSDPIVELWDEQQKQLGTDFPVTKEFKQIMNRIATEHARSIASTRQDRIRRIVSPKSKLDPSDIAKMATGGVVEKSDALLVGDDVPETLRKSTRDPDRTFRSTRRKQLQELYSQTKDGAEAYAVTESLQAGETARYESARNSSETAKFRTRKVWFTQGDSLVRPDHSAVNGQNRFVNHRGWGGRPGRFSVGGAALQYPRDPGGPAAQVINCRCFLEYRRVKAKT